jgi:Skp family chaperone for outer membrane proteins
MRLKSAGRLWTLATLAWLAVAFMAQLSTYGDDTTKIPKKGEAVLGRRVRRLPAHFAKVVTESQRKQIYKIQEEYQAKLDALEAQLKALKKERKDRITAVLTPEQRKKVEAASGKTKETLNAPDELGPESPMADDKMPQ